MHYHYMDALRGTFMLVGVFVHASSLGRDPFFDGIAYASGLFRMEDFFLISGFLSAMLVGKYGPSRTVRRRLASVGIPLLCTGLLLNPVAIWLSYNFHNDPDVSFLDYLHGRTIADPAGELRWHLHLWFLVVLIPYALITPAAVFMLTRLASLSLFRRATTGRLPAMATIIFLAVAGVVVVRGTHKALLDPIFAGTALDYPVEQTMEYLPFFLLGVLLYLGRDRLLPSFQRPAPVLLAVSASGLLAGSRGWVGVLASNNGRLLCETVFTIALTATLFALAGRLITRQRPVIRYLADASYTVYLFHYFWIYVIATLLGFDSEVRWPQMLLVTSLTFGVTFAIHHFVILRSRVLRGIFNGKFPIRTRGSRRAPGVHQPSAGTPAPAAALTMSGAPTIPLHRVTTGAGGPTLPPMAGAPTRPLRIR
ncbi:glucans biosynthesis protein MdoC [Parafrankia discariae]|uniref:glucans biosynthesis protein MdoC n=1 Tax=Parafrankia discariae TaxID=365528 RepID=UPI00037374AA|nr:glucans biosynthesis protein MdoC [Parafrankia discariae]